MSRFPRSSRVLAGLLSTAIVGGAARRLHRGSRVRVASDAGRREQDVSRHRQACPLAAARAQEHGRGGARSRMVARVPRPAAHPARGARRRAELRCADGFRPADREPCAARHGGGGGLAERQRREHDLSPAIQPERHHQPPSERRAGRHVGNGRHVRERCEQHHPIHRQARSKAIRPASTPPGSSICGAGCAGGSRAPKHRSILPPSSGGIRLSRSKRSSHATTSSCAARRR